MNDFLGHATTDLAMHLLREGKLHECIGCIEKVVSSNPDDAKAYSILGAAYAQAGDQGMSIAAFEKSLNLEPCARAHFNLGMAYEKSGRARDALEQYEYAVRIDPLYRQAAEAVNRLSKAGTGGPASQSHERGTQAHLLTDDTVAEPPPPVTDSDMQNTSEQPTESDPAPTDQTVMQGPLLLNTDDSADPDAVTITGAAHTQPGDLQPVGIPAVAPPPQPARLPNLNDLEYRARTNEEKAKKAQRDMMKAGLIYGIIVGPAGLMGTLLFARILFGAAINFFVVLIAGVVLGAIVGLWTGLTCGDEMTGAKVGVLAGIVGLAIPSLFIKGGPDIVVTAIFAVFGAIIGGASGYFIGMMVEHSIGQ